MALIAMCCHDTEENGRSKYTSQTIESLFETVDFTQDKLVIIDNASCQETKELMKELGCILDTKKFKENHIPFVLITNSENLGTAKAINQAWSLREPNEVVIKMDNDVVINNYGWIEEMELAMKLGGYGIVGLKRKDLMQHPNAKDNWKTELKMLPHEKGDNWVVVEESADIMGTVQMFNPSLINKMGGLMQAGVYGFDDTLACIRAILLGYKLAFLPHIDIDHIDVGGDAYTEWKRKYAGEKMEEFYKIKDGLINGTIPIKVEL
jgi:GT2 family glycosyltransferase